MRRKISHILLALIIAYASLIGCMFLAVYHYEATVVAEEREEQHEDKIEQLDENKSIHKDFVDELNGDEDIVKDHETKSNSEILAEIVEYRKTHNYAALFERSAPCGHHVGLKGRLVSGYEYMCRYIRRYILR